MFLYPYPHPVHFTEVNNTPWTGQPNLNTTLGDRITFSTSSGLPPPPQQQQQQQQPLSSSSSSSSSGMQPQDLQRKTSLLELGHIQLEQSYTIDEKPNLDGFLNNADIGTSYSTKEKCPNCSELILQSDLINHIRNHMGPRRCEICNYEAPTKHHLREHMNTHTGLKPYKCIYCDKSFAAKNSLRVHTMYLHTKIRSHQCHFCEQRFVTTSERKSHELVHTDKCPICSMSFRLRGHLRQHMKIHSNSHFHHRRDGGGNSGGGGGGGNKRGG